MTDIKKYKNFLSKIKAPWFVVFYAFTLFFATALNQQLLTHFYKILENSSNVDFVFALTPPIVLFFALSIVFLFFSGKYVFKIAFTFFILTGSIVNYFAYKYGIIFDYDMMVNIFSTNTQEAWSYLNTESILNFVFLGIVPVALLWKIKIIWPASFIRAVLERFCILAVAFIVLGLISFFYYQNYASIGRNNSILRKEISPYNYVWYGYKALKQIYFPQKIKFDQFGENSFIDNPLERPELVVVLVGETARAQNFKHNGYGRNTTPYTDKFTNLIKFAPVKTCGTATAVSVPCMFSNQTRVDYDEEKAKNSSNLTDLLRFSGYKVLWFDNDGGCKGVCNRVSTKLIDANDPQNKKYCKDGSCYDEVLLPYLERSLKESSASVQNTVVFLHIIGSHGPTYFARVPEDKKVFLPTCNRGDIENCTQEEIINAYDNTLVYTDFVVSKSIELLKQYEDKFGTALIYISDHGESLGEMGLYLHGTPYSLAPDEQKEVPFMTWFSDSFIVDHRLNLDCLDKVSKERFSHDNFYHSLIGILDVNTSFYNRDDDIFQKCRIWNKRKLK